MKKNYLHPELKDERLTLIDVMTASGEAEQSAELEDVIEDANTPIQSVFGV